MTELSVAIVQSGIAWHNPDENRQHFAQQIRHACEPSPDLVVLPEMFSTGFSMQSELAETMDGTTVNWLQEMADQFGTAITGSLMVRHREGAVNRLLVARPGQPLLIYDKRHLFRMAEEQDHYLPGNNRLVFEIAGFRICAQVCYDLRFPVWQRNRGDYDLLLVVANWPAARRHHWRTLLQARAIENLCFSVGVNRVGTDGNGTHYGGDSLVSDPQGNLLLDLGDQPKIGHTRLSLQAVEDWRSQFPAWMDADEFELTGHQKP